MTDRTRRRHTGEGDDPDGTLPDSGMGTASEDEPPGAQSGVGPAPLDRDTLAAAGNLAAPGPGPRGDAAEESDEVRRAAAEEATAEPYRTGGAPPDDDTATFVEPEH